MDHFRSPQRARIVIAVGAVVLIAAAGGGVWYGASKARPIVSDDGAATLVVPRGALPEGTRVSDLAIRKVTDDNRAGAEPAGAPIAAYRLEPHGLTFGVPVTLTVVMPPTLAARTAPSVHIVNEDTRTIETLEAVASRDDAGAVTVSAQLSHFSLVLYSSGLIAVETSNDLGTHAVGESFTFPVTLSRLAQAPFWKEPFKEIMEGRPSFVAAGRFVSRAPAIVQPEDQRAAPPEGAVMNEDSMTATGRFRCVRAGAAAVAYETLIHYAHRFAPPGDLPPFTKTLGDTIRVWPEAAVRCTAPVSSAAPPPESSPTPTPAEVSMTGEGDGTPAPATPAVVGEPSARPATPTPAAAVSRNSNRAPTVGPITAVLNPPTTTYTVRASDPDGNALTYRWGGSVSCGSYAPPASAGATTAQWSHQDGDPPNCPHDQGTSHPGTVSVRVSDGTATITCTYEGSESGTGPACTLAR